MIVRMKFKIDVYTKILNNNKSYNIKIIIIIIIIQEFSEYISGYYSSAELQKTAGRCGNRAHPEDETKVTI
jgi:hypothetical protein